MEKSEIILTKKDLLDEYKTIPFNEITLDMFNDINQKYFILGVEIIYREYIDNSDIPYISKKFKFNPYSIFNGSSNNIAWSFSELSKSEQERINNLFSQRMKND